MAQNIHRLRKISIMEFVDWVPHELMVNNFLNQISICDSLLKRNEIEVLGRKSLAAKKNGSYAMNVCIRSWTKVGKALQMVEKPKFLPQMIMITVC